jgi:hypothetical protein
VGQPRGFAVYTLLTSISKPRIFFVHLGALLATAALAALMLGLANNFQSRTLSSEP